MPGAADDGDALEPLLVRGPDRLAHVRFALGLLRALLALCALLARRVRLRAQRRHRFQDALEEPYRVYALLDLLLPPQLAVAVARGLRQRADRIVAHGRRGERHRLFRRGRLRRLRPLLLVFRFCSR